jgi:hypothetical protein
MRCRGLLRGLTPDVSKRGAAHGWIATTLAGELLRRLTPDVSKRGSVA